MTRANDIASLVDANGDVVASALDNVPASNDASALTTGTLNAARLPTEIVSSDATPQLSGALETNGNNIRLGDSSGANVNRIQLGDSQDMAIYHDGSNSNIRDGGTGNLKLLASNFALQNSAANHNAMVYTDGGAVSLYHNNSKKFETSAAGCVITGDLSVSGSIAGAGKILQMVTNRFSNVNQTTSSSTFQNSVMTATITPTSSSSQIYGIFNFTSIIDAYANNGVDAEYRITNNGTEIHGMKIGAWTDVDKSFASIHYVDSPATTSAITYLLQYRRSATYSGNGAVGLQATGANNDMTVILFEVGA